VTRVLACALAASFFCVATGASLDPQPRRVYVAALDGKGSPVTDLSPADFLVKEGGKARDVIKADPATGRMQIAILVDDNGTGMFRYGVAKFIETLQGRAEFAISTVTGQMLRLTDYTTSVPELTDAIGKINARPASNDGGQLLEGISETAVDMMKRRAGRPIILALTVGGEEHSTLPAHHVLDQLRLSGAALHVVAVVGSTLRSTVAPSSPAALLQENMNLGEVLGDGSKHSGGSYSEITAVPGMVANLQQLADSLKNQYAIEYALPDGVKPSDRLSVMTKRRGVTLRAPTHISDK